MVALRCAAMSAAIASALAGQSTQDQTKQDQSKQDQTKQVPSAAYQQAARLSALQWTDADGDLVAMLQIFELPSALHQDAGAAQFDAPMLDAIALRDVDFNVCVWIGPFKDGDRAGERRGLRRVKQGEGMMGQCQIRAGKQGSDENQAAGTDA